ncbi:putative abhydrolase domain-containing protein [Forsythia ovata]|uniref:Abhydrolase domain-containing protein n=1 Tax=Forsythia ovata TaxID=205694 RepID=A0ABD1XDU4_9LAMI
MLLDHLAKADITVDSFWTERWAAYSTQAFSEQKLAASKALATWSMMLVEEAKLKADLQNTEFNVAEFSKRYDHTTRAQELTTKALEKSNAQKKGLVDKVEELENALDYHKAENSGLKEERLQLERRTKEAVKVGVENFRNQFEFTQNYKNIQAFFVNFGARQILSELKELHPSLDLSALDADYPALEEAGEEATQPLTDGA